MTNIGDALSGGGSSASGISDTTLSDASLGDQMMGGGGDFGTGNANAFGSAGNDFNSFNAITNALSGGGGGASPAASITPTPSASAAPGSDPTGAAGGTQSNTAPGSTPTNQNQQQQTGDGKQQNPDYAPPSAVAQLKSLLKQLNTGKPPGPTGPVPQGGQNAPFALPTLAAGQTGPQSALRQLVGSQPAAASLEGGAPEMGPGFAGSQPGGAADIRTGLPTGTSDQNKTPVEQDPNVQEGEPLTAAGTPASQTPLPPARPDEQNPNVQEPAAAGPGGDITVKPKGGAQPTQDLPTRVPPGSAAPPTKKPGASPAPQPAPQGPATSSIMRDISGVSTGSPTALADLAQAAKVIIPMLPLLAGLFGGGGRRGRGGFHGGRFTHGVGGGMNGFRGGMNAMGHLHGGRHPMAPGAWPYHHEMHGWHMHPRHPGPGWLPLNPIDAQGIVGGGQQGQDPNNPNQDPNAPDPNRPPKETGATVGEPDSVGTSGAIPGVSGKQVDDYTRQVAQSYGIDPDVASKILGQESSYGQARRPGDNGTSFGPFQLHFEAGQPGAGNAMGDQFYRDTGLDPRDPRTWKQQVDYAMMKASQEGWKPWTTSMKKLGMNQWSGITTNPRYAGKMSNKPLPQETRVTPDMLEKLPVTSQPMVSG